MSKPKSESRTLKFSTALIAAGMFLTLLTSQPGIQEAIPEWVYGVLISLAGTISYVLRLKTTGPVE